MSATVPKPPAPVRPADRVRSFLGYAFLISLAIHLVSLPLLQLKGPPQEKEAAEKVSLTKKIKVVVPTPPPPTPTPPPPTPPPKATPPPVKQTAPPPVPKLVVKPPKTTTQSKSGPSEVKADTSRPVNENGVPQGNVASAPAVVAPASTAKPETPAPTPAPPTPTPKPACAVPNAPATTTRAAELEFPEVAKQQGASGVAVVKVTLDATGHVTDAEINKSSGFPSLDQEGLKAARASSYSAEVVDCVKTAGSYLFRADFTAQ